MLCGKKCTEFWGTVTCLNLKLTDGTTQCFHTGLDCQQTSQGGSAGIPQYDSTRKKPFCKFVGAYCPAGWTQLGSWSITANVSCAGGSSTNWISPFFGVPCAGYHPYEQYCDTSFHSDLKDLATESCKVDTVAACGPAMDGNRTCYATVTHVGCY